MEFDPTEILSLCDEIMEDGELSYSEIRGLAKWFNANSEAKNYWPGKLLFEPLRDAWADQKITVIEARTIAGLLVNIRKEADERERKSFTQLQIAPPPIKEFHAFDPKQAVLPLINHSMPLESESTEGVRYMVSLNGPTCECPDFTSNRLNLPRGHLTRCCKHILKALKYSKQDYWPEWLVTFVDLSWRIHPATKWQLVGGALVSSAPTEWANIYVDGQRFGYSILEERWSYGTEPDNATALSRTVHRLSDD